MSDTPTPPASVSPPPAPTDSPRRADTFLGRLAQAVREQNWFAVVLEAGPWQVAGVIATIDDTDRDRTVCEYG